MPDLQGGYAIGQFKLIRRGMMHQHCHADIGFIDSMTQALQEGIVIIETGEDFAQSAKDAAFGALGGIAAAWSSRVLVQVICHATTETVIQSDGAKLLAVLDIGRAAETHVAFRIE